APEDRLDPIQFEGLVPVKAMLPLPVS
ncbi:hypothetical protein HKBW3S34_02479, partial [Candidatus Hakubella thermalkaliphila]